MVYEMCCSISMRLHMITSIGLKVNTGDQACHNGQLTHYCDQKIRSRNGIKDIMYTAGQRSAHQMYCAYVSCCADAGAY